MLYNLLNKAENLEVLCSCLFIHEDSLVSVEKLEVRIMILDFCTNKMKTEE